ncbi:MAG: hypothetical protein Q9160_000312 [Pyrenula sp. 1 TL-2023]
MARLEEITHAGGERKDAADHCRDGIMRLSNEFQPVLDRFIKLIYSIGTQAIKALNEKLNQIREQSIPPPRFSFKTARKNPSAVSLSDAADLAAQKKRLVPGYQSSISSAQNSSAPFPKLLPTPPAAEEISKPKLSTQVESSEGLEVPSIAQASQDSAQRQPNDTGPMENTVDISYENQKHILLPSTPERSTIPAMLSYLNHCVVDLSMNSSKMTPFASLTIKAVQTSLLIGGEIDGATYLTNVEQSVIVILGTGQLRLHRCKNVQRHVQSDDHPLHQDRDMWDKVDDFNWLRAEPSPNWRTMLPEEETPDEVWTDIVPGGPGWSLRDILQATKVLRL